MGFVLVVHVRLLSLARVLGGVYREVVVVLRVEIERAVYLRPDERPEDCLFSDFPSRRIEELPYSIPRDFHLSIAVKKPCLGGEVLVVFHLEHVSSLGRILQHFLHFKIGMGIVEERR